MGRMQATTMIIPFSGGPRGAVRFTQSYSLRSAPGFQVELGPNCGAPSFPPRDALDSVSLEEQLSARAITSRLCLRLFPRQDLCTVTCSTRCLKAFRRAPGQPFPAERIQFYSSHVLTGYEHQANVSPERARKLSFGTASVLPDR
jgi:hypothetical protein